MGLNASYTLAYSRGNSRAPSTRTTNFADSGRTETFDDPWVNSGGNGYLPNDRRHQFKLRGSYRASRQLAGRRDARRQSGRPVSAFGWATRSTTTAFHSFYTCVRTAHQTSPECMS